MFINLKKKITESLFLTTTAVFFMAAVSSQSVAGQVGNGGGGISRGGRPMTFYSAGIIVEPNGLTSHEIPEVENLMNFINDDIYLSTREKSKLIREIGPSTSRRYFKVKNEQFTKEIRNRIIKEYTRISKVDASQLTLFAITDTQQRITYLLPDFYRLSPLEKMAILYHEAYWILNPNFSYDKIVQAELNFQAYLENPKSELHAYNWIEATQSVASALSTSIKIDLQNGFLDSLLYDKRYLKTSNVLGKNYYDCRYKGSYDFCYEYISPYLFQLKNSFPQSYFIRFLYSQFKESLSKVTIWDNPPSRMSGRILKTPNITHEFSSPCFLDLKSNYIDMGIIENKSDPYADTCSMEFYDEFTVLLRKH